MMNHRKNAGKNILKQTGKETKDDDLNREFKILYSQLLQISGKSRSKSLGEEEMTKAVEKLWNMIKAKFLQVCRKPVYSRGIQSLLKWGSNEYRVAIFEKMKNYIVELSKDSHSSRIVEKMYVYGNPDIRKTIRNELLNKFDQVGFSKYGSRVFEYLFSEKRNQNASINTLNSEILHRVLSTKLADFYGIDNTNNSKQKHNSFTDFFMNISENNARKSILDNSVNIIQKFVDSELLNRQFVHLLIWNYIKCCIYYYNLESGSDTLKTDNFQSLTLKDITEEGKTCLTSLLEQIIEGSYSLLTTKEGVDSLIVLLGFSRAQQRKKILKAIKRDVYELIMNPVDYSLILRLVSTTDDTKILSEVILNSLIKDGIIHRELFNNIYFVKLASYLLSSQNYSRYFNQYELWVLNLESFTSLKSEGLRKDELNKIFIPALCKTMFGTEKEQQESVLEMIIKNQNGKELILLLLQYLIQRNKSEDCVNKNDIDYGVYIPQLVRGISDLLDNNNDVLKDIIAHRTLVSMFKIVNENELCISSMFDPIRNKVIQVFEKNLKDMLKSRAVFVLVEIIGQIYEKKDFKSCTMWRVRVRELVKNDIQDCIYELKEGGNSTAGIELVSKYANIEISQTRLLETNGKNNSLGLGISNNKKQIKKRSKSDDNLGEKTKQDKKIHL